VTASPLLGGATPPLGAKAKGAMKTYQECVRELDDRIPHQPDPYIGGFLDAIAFAFDKNRAQVVRDVQAYRAERNYEEDEDIRGTSN
jgi:hypothetical protein